MSQVGKTTLRLSDNALTTLPLIAYLALSIGMMVADHRVGYGPIIRQHSSLITEPLWWLASLPTRTLGAAQDALSLRSRLQDDNTRIRHALEVATARIHRLNAIGEENQRLRHLLGGTRGYSLNVQMVGILDVDLDPYRQRLVLDAGSDGGVRVGQVLIDSGGVLGQIIEVTASRSTALLLTDPDHAVPVQLARSGLRAIAYGTGRNDQLSLPNIPRSADVRVGDELVTSGIGGRFPAGFPVGVITDLHPDDSRLFVVAEARPAANLERGNEVLLISNLPPAFDIGPPTQPTGQAQAIPPRPSKP